MSEENAAPGQEQNQSESPQVENPIAPPEGEASASAAKLTPKERREQTRLTMKAYTSRILRETGMESDEEQKKQKPWVFWLGRCIEVVGACLLFYFPFGFYMETGHVRATQWGLAIFCGICMLY
jgi:hypothetical protein